MKRFFYIMFACACALFVFVSNAEAQTTGDIVTIKTESGNNYLAAYANGTIYNCTSVNDDCYWLVTRTGRYGDYEYTFRSLSTGTYLHAERTGKGTKKDPYVYSLSLGTESSFTFDNKKLSADNCYVSYSNEWMGANSGTNLTIAVIKDFTRQFIDVDPADESELDDALTTITLTAETGVVIDNDSFTKNSFTLTGPTGTSISNVTASGNVLTITVANGNSEGDYKLSFSKGAIEDQYGISFAAATYSWKVSDPYHKFTSVTPAEGVTQAFNTITLTTDVEMADLQLGYYYPDNNEKISFYFTSADGSIKEAKSIITQGLDVKKKDSKTLEITTPQNLGEGTYRLEVEKGAVKGSDGVDFQAKTFNWTVEPHTFASISPEAVSPGEHLSDITLTAPEGVLMSIQDASKIVLKNAGDAIVPTTATITADNKLVITPAAPLGNGSYTLNIAKGAVVGPHLVSFNAYDQKWNVVVSVSITHVNGFYPALGAGGYQQVHTVERTIYYTGTETSIPLELAETNFFGYMRWYNYATDGGEDITWTTEPLARNNAEFEQITGSAKHLGWFAWATGANNGDGVLSRQSDQVSGNNTPAINVSGWTGNHTIACDVSNYLDYTITRVGDEIVGITEPRLSYRQLFHFKPASEMAAKLDACKGDKYLETYYYTAPKSEYDSNGKLVPTNIYLATAYHHSMSNAMQNNYFYNAANPTRISADNLSWYQKGVEDALDKDYDTQDFQTVYSASGGEVTYYLRAVVGDQTYNIAKFVVNYVDKATYGPVKETGTNGSAKALISYNEMNNLYEVLEYNDFNFNKKSSTTEHYLDAPLPYLESTYGFYYNANKVKANSSIQHNSSLPYYGEYGIVNQLTSQSWALGANHVDGVTDDGTAGKQGYALYVDGTSEPGVVASISTKATICGERTMYCSVWLRNPGSSNAKPIFRCNIQGRNRYSNGTYTPWEDVAVYFVGDLGYSSGWNQVRFPFKSTDTYTECRVQIYNFGIGVYGNDFWLDDLCIYADKLPMASYQLQTEMCCSPNHDGTTFTAAVLRVDYGSTTLVDDSYQYYQIYNKTTKKPLKLTTASLSPYYHEDTQSAAPEGLTKEEYGSIKVRNHEFDPNTEEGAKICTPGKLVGELLESYNTDNTKPLWGKCYVAKTEAEKQSTPGNYYMYVVHIIPNIRSNRVEENYLQEHCQYTLRMTSEARDLLYNNLSCAVEIDLPSTQESLYRLMSEQIETTEFLCNSTNNCPNDQYTIEAFIRKDSDPYSDAGEVEGTYLADWMYGHAFDEVYRMDYLMDHPDLTVTDLNTAKRAADEQFANVYKCTRAQVTDAFLDLRRPDDNDNYDVKTFDEIDPSEFTDYDTPPTKKYPSKSLHYETLKYLHNQGWLQLATSSVSFYLGAGETARYWVFPIENSATAADGTPLHDCPEPRWVQVNTKASNYYINLAPGLNIGDQTQQQADPRNSNTIPHVRVLARMVNNTIQIPIHQISSDDYEIQFAGDDGYIYLTNDDQISNPQSMKYTCSSSNNVITLMPAAGNTAQLQQGKEYTMCILMRNKAGEYRSANDDCAVGKVYVKLLILPDVVTWAPTTTDMSWHNDANWDAAGDYHYAPIAGSNVIIPADEPSPILSTIDVANGDQHPYPLDANFALAPTCGQIYFEPGAMMLNQHLLTHEKAFVDLVVPNQTWNTVAVPISGVVSGDMYIPHNGDEKTGSSTENNPADNPFVVNGFTGARHSESAFPFWLSVYNKTVQVVNENPSKTGSTISTNTETFAPTNSLVEPIEVGSGYQLLGFGPNNYTANDLTIRLPKPDATYAYYYHTGALGSNVQVERGESAGQLIYDPSTPIVLKNERSSNSFMLGNPTMAKIDLASFIPEGATVYQMVKDTWIAETKVTMFAWAETNIRYLEPMRAVLLKMPSASQRLELSLQTEHLTTSDGLSSQNDGPNQVAAVNAMQLMTIYAEIYGTKARCVVASKDGMKDSYVVGEDALFISSGVEAEVNDATATSPVNMYTVSDNVPLMVDIREKIDTIPLGMLIHDYYRTEKITMTFNLSANWDKECYFCDAVTGNKTLITDGLTIEVDMPQNHEVRYFIDGPDVIDPDNGGDIWSSTEDVKTSDMQVWAYSPSQGELVVASNDIIKEVTVYDVAGRVIAHQTLDLQYSSMTIATIPGVCIVETTMRDNTKHYTQTVVR